MIYDVHVPLQPSIYYSTIAVLNLDLQTTAVILVGTLSYYPKEKTYYPNLVFENITK